MKVYLFLVSCLLLAMLTHSHVYGQQQAITSAGQQVISDNAQLSWTLGQVVSTNSTSNAIYLGQGFHTGQQPLSVVSGLPKAQQEIHIYPNPTVDQLSITTASGPYKGSYQLINTLGKVVEQSQEVDFSYAHAISMYHHSEGTYVLRIKIENQQIRNYKIIKQ